MSEPVRPWKWTKRRAEAAQLVAEGRLSGEAIAAQVGICDRQLRRWRRRPEFQARVADLSKRIEAEVFSRGIGNRARRVAALSDRWEKMQALIAARAADPTMAEIPGGTTGLLVHDVKQVGHGATARTVDLYAFDAALFRELREHERQASEETGQRVTKVAPTTPDGMEAFEAPAVYYTDAERRAIVEVVLRQLGVTTIAVEPMPAADMEAP